MYRHTHTLFVLFLNEWTLAQLPACLNYSLYCLFRFLSLISYSFFSNFPPFVCSMSSLSPSLVCPLASSMKVTVQQSTVQAAAVQRAGCGSGKRPIFPSTMLFVGSDGRTGNSRMIQLYRVRIYDYVPWRPFPYNEHSTSSLEALLRNEDEDTQIKRSDRKGDQGRFQE